MEEEKIINIVPRDKSNSLLNAINSKTPVEGLTHNFYRYPARFSPLFSREIIKAFSKPGDIVFDPFMGGGTTLVEALSLGRSVVGTDISPLASFISNVKTSLLSDSDISIIKDWSNKLHQSLDLRNPPSRAIEWLRNGYQRNISNRTTWPIRKTIEFIIANLNGITNKKQERFIRCTLLKTAQWALDCRKDIPSAKEFREAFFLNLEEMITGMVSFRKHVNESKEQLKYKHKINSLCLCRSVIGIEKERKLAALSTPNLVLTSPPYPGVHILYHRWQVQGRKETPAPFWITNSLDGNGASYYTLGDRKQKDLSRYYNQIYNVFNSITKILDKKSLVVQMLAFSNPSWQLPRYLKTMKQVGLMEITIKGISNTDDGRLWREVPNRKWYTNQKTAIATSKEVVLFHRLS